MNREAKTKGELEFRIFELGGRIEELAYICRDSPIPVSELAGFLDRLEGLVAGMERAVL